MAVEEAYRQKKVPQKSQERGWYVVEAITGHRIAKHKKRDVLELQVQWENYDEPTWEGFTHFVKETTPIVEKYIIQKSLMKPLQLQAEYERAKKVNQKSDSRDKIKSDLAISKLVSNDSKGKI